MPLRENTFTLEIRPFGNGCSVNCPFCYQVQPYENEEPLKFEYIHELISSLMKYWNEIQIQNLKIVIHGGEPFSDYGEWFLNFVNKEYPKIKKLLNQQNIESSILCHSSGRIPLKLTKIPNIKLSFALTHPGSEKLFTIFKWSSHQIRSFSNNVNFLMQKKLLSKFIIPISFIHLDNIQSIFDFVEKQTIQIKFLPMFPDIDQGNADTDYSISKQKYSEFLNTIGNRLLTKKRNISNIEPFNRLLWDSKSLIKKDCRFTTSCPISNQFILSIALDNDGSLYPCNRFAGIKKLKNSDYPIFNETVISFLASLKTGIHRNKTQCIDCNYNNFYCSGLGGCPFLGYVYKSKFNVDVFCKEEFNTIINLKNQLIFTN